MPIIAPISINVFAKNFKRPSQEWQQEKCATGWRGSLAAMD
jgi:hypothetical protein